MDLNDLLSEHGNKRHERSFHGLRLKRYTQELAGPDSAACFIGRRNPCGHDC